MPITIDYLHRIISRVGVAVEALRMLLNSRGRVLCKEFSNRRVVVSCTEIVEACAAVVDFARVQELIRGARGAVLWAIGNVVAAEHLRTRGRGDKSDAPQVILVQVSRRTPDHLRHLQ